MESFSKVIGDAMKADSELYELAMWGDEMFALQDKKNQSEHWTAKYIDDDFDFEAESSSSGFYNFEKEEWDFPDPPDISSRWDCT